MSILKEALLRADTMMKGKRKVSGKRFAIVLIILVILGLLITARPPRDFPVGSIIKIEDGMTASSLAPELERSQFIRSPWLFKNTMRFLHDGTIIAGDYKFNKKVSAFEMARRFKEGDFSIETVKVTIPEGVSTRELAALVSDQLPGINVQELSQLAEQNVGYLFPNTYNVPPTITAQEMVERMISLFDQETADLKKQAERTRHSWADVVIMASILEKEAHNQRDRKMIADILWRRLDEGMRLQVDAPFLALEGKGSSTITQEDLFNDSDYNTYRNDGLTPTPITNPGKESLDAAINPIPNSYVFYLADDRGVTHFSTTFDEHVNKKQQYLSN